MPIINHTQYDNFNTLRWLDFSPPRGFGETFTLSKDEAWRRSLGSNLLDLSPWGRSGDIESIKRERERNLEVLSPEQAIREYPDSAKIIKKPVTRAEAIYWAREQEQRRKFQKAFSGSYDGSLPEEAF